MGANIAGIYGAQIFREEDRPRYRRGFGVNIAVLAIGLSLAILRFVEDRLRRRRSAKQVRTRSSSEHTRQIEDIVPAAPPSDVQPQTVLVEKDLKPVVLSEPVK